MKVAGLRPSCTKAQQLHPVGARPPGDPGKQPLNRQSPQLSSRPGLQVVPQQPTPARTPGGKPSWQTLLHRFATSCRRAKTSSGNGTRSSRSFSLARCARAPSGRTVTYATTPGLFEFVSLKQYLEESLGRPVDLVTEGALKERMKNSILQEAVRVA